MPLFSVPQFIESETPIVGPLTFRQFIILLITVAVCFIIYQTLPRFISISLLIIAGAFGLSLAFLKIGEIPFYKVFLEGLYFILRPKRFSWGKGGGKSIVLEKMELKKEEKGEIKVKRESKLKETAIKIETKK
jgi:hypothetical protein